MYIEDTPGSLTWLRFGSTSPLYRWTQKWDPRRRSTHTYLCKPPLLLYIGSLLPRTLQKIHLFVIRDQWDSGIYTNNEWLSWKWFVLREYSELVGHPHRMENVCVYVLLAILSHPQLLSADACNEDGTNDSCWYTFWYVWVALGLFITVLITMVIVYYKHKWSKRRTRVRRIAVVQPQNPPPYEAPSQLPPSYEDSLKHSVAINIPGYHVMESRPGMIRGHHLVNVDPATPQHSRPNQSRGSQLSMPPNYEHATSSRSWRMRSDDTSESE